HAPRHTYKYVKRRARSFHCLDARFICNPRLLYSTCWRCFADRPAVAAISTAKRAREREGGSVHGESSQFLRSPQTSQVGWSLQTSPREHLWHRGVHKKPLLRLARRQGDLLRCAQGTRHGGREEQALRGGRVPEERTLRLQRGKNTLLQRSSPPRHGGPQEQALQVGRLPEAGKLRATGQDDRFLLLPAQVTRDGRPQRGTDRVPGPQRTRHGADEAIARPPGDLDEKAQEEQASWDRRRRSSWRQRRRRCRSWRTTERQVGDAVPRRRKERRRKSWEFDPDLFRRSGG
ncbi:unnamed protein product, partial [Scytosiphon promiscuus]